MRVFLIASRHESERTAHIQELRRLVSPLTHVEAVYPAFERVPFIEKIQAISRERTGKALRVGEIGCLLSHRKVWHMIREQATDDEEAFLVLESDSMLLDVDFLKAYFTTAHENYDLFFWGTFANRVALLKRQPITKQKGYAIGRPLINSLYCTYGYSVNKKAAGFLLHQSRTVNYPVDHWKRRLYNAPLKVGSIKPQIICTEDRFDSSIQADRRDGMYHAVFDGIVDIKNKIISFIK